MKLEEVISQLESLQVHCQEWWDKDEEDSIWGKDVQALDKAIEAVKKQIPKEVETVKDINFTRHYCPCCNRLYWDYIEDYCSSCGQRLENLRNEKR